MENFINMETNLPKSFDELVETHDKPILVDFWAPWCGPCKMVAPELEKLAKDWKGKASIVKVNTDEKQDLARKYKISGIPTLILFKDGKEVHRVSGAMRSEDYQKVFDGYL